MPAWLAATCAAHFCASSSGPAPAFASSVESFSWYFEYSRSAAIFAIFCALIAGVRLQHQHILLRLGELRLELPHLVFVGTPVELEERLPLLHGNIRLHQHVGDERGLRQPRNELDRVLDDARLGRRRRDVAQAEQKDDPEMQHEEGREEPPGDGEFQPPELEEHQPDDEAVGEQQDESEQHGRSLLAFLPVVRWSRGVGVGRGAALPQPALPFR